MKKIDRQFIKMQKIEDTDVTRKYLAISGECIGIASYDKKTNSYSYEGDDLRRFSKFVEDTIVGSVRKGVELPESFAYGYG